MQKIKKPGSVKRINTRNTNGILSNTGLFVVKAEIWIVKIYDAKNINEIPTICPNIGKAIYLKNFSKFKKYSLIPLKNIFITLTNVESFFATVISPE